jgi:transcriptional regulator with XRE-family HTH domain
MRDVAVRAPMALGYLSEVERGQKDVSSELFNTIARGLGLPISELTKRTADVLTEWEQQEIEQKELARLTR